MELASQARVVTVLRNIIHAILSSYWVSLIKELLVKNLTNAAIQKLDEVCIKHISSAQFFISCHEELLDWLNRINYYFRMLIVIEASLEAIGELGQVALIAVE